MAIKKQYLKSKPVCKVTFQLAAKESTNVSVVGDFNKWNTDASPLKKLKNGTFKAVLPFETGNSYEFKYVVDGNYVNDDNADSFLWNDYANSENSVLEL